MKDFIENSISWNELAPHERSGLIFEIEHVCLLKDEMEPQLDVSLNFVIPFHDLQNIKENLKKEINGVSNVSFRFRYENMALGECEIIKLAVPHMFNAMPEFAKYAHAADLNECENNEEHVIIYCLGEQPAKILNEVAAPAMHNMLMHDFGINRVFAFRNKSDSYSRRIEAMEMQSADELKKVHVEMERAAKAARENPRPAVSRTPASEKKQFDASSSTASPQSTFAPAGGGKPQRKRGYEGPVTGNRIVGKPVNGQKVKIKELHSNSKDIVIEGSVFRTESRALKNGKSLAFIYMTDHTDSVCVKMFITSQKQEDFDEYIKTGTYIRVQGDCEYDNFEKMVVLMGRSVELAEKPERPDNSERKRVELHAHTLHSRLVIAEHCAILFVHILNAIIAHWQKTRTAIHGAMTHWEVALLPAV